MYSRLKRAIIVVMAVVLATMVAYAFVLTCGLRIVVQPDIAEVSPNLVGIECDSNIVSDYQAKLEIVPKPILQSFVANAWTLCVDPSFLSQKSEETSIFWGGATVYADRKIYVCTPESVVHEFGHYLDYALGFPRRHITLFELEAESAKDVLGVYATTNCREYFAEFFEYWLYNRQNPTAMERLKKVSPETYQYFLSLEIDNWGLNVERIVLMVG